MIKSLRRNRRRVVLQFKQHLTSSQQELLIKVGEGKMTPEIDASLKKVVVDHVTSFVSA